MRRVIINADDFGINPIVTSETIRLLKSGLISSATVMANGKCLDDVRKASLDYPDASFGVHLCLTEFDSLTKSEVFKKYGITDNNGCFIKKAIFSIKDYPTELLEAVKAELSAQIELVLSLGIKISHADSHHLSHTSLYGLKEVFIEVLNEYNINKVRIGGRVNVTDIIINNIKRRIKKNSNSDELGKAMHLEGNNSKGSYYKRFRKLINTSKEHSAITACYRHQFVTTDLFASYSEFINNGAKLPDNGTIELMCHPGHPSADYTLEIRNIEERLLNNFFSYSLISYNQL